MLPLQPQNAFDMILRLLNRRVGRVIDRAGLEIRYTPFGYRGFESLTLRNEKRKSLMTSFFSLFTLCLEGQVIGSSITCRLLRRREGSVSTLRVCLS